MSFTHLRVHSDNSILNGVLKVGQIAKLAKDSGMSAVALTDLSAMYGTFYFHGACKGEEIKPIIGCQFNLAPRTMQDREHRRDEKTTPIVLLAKNLNGYKNLITLVTNSHLKGFYYKARVDKDLLEQHSSDLICLSGGTFGLIGTHFYLGENEKAYEEAKFLKKIYGENFYLEINRLGIQREDVVNPKLVDLAKKEKLKLVATNDVYYAKEEDAEVREVLWCIDDGRVLADPSRRKPDSNQHYFKSAEEMEKLFKDLPEAIKSTEDIKNKIEEYDIGYGKVQPVYPGIPEKETEESYLKKLVYDGAKVKYGKVDKTLKKRLDYELEVIHDMGYDGYFLVVSDIVNWAREQGIMISNRGSAAASCISYCLDITFVDPISWRMPFGRFLSRERPTFPDIDLDIADDRREEVINHVRDNYGEECVCAIGALGKLTTKAAIRDVGRVLDIDLKIIDRLSKLVPVKFGKVLSIHACVGDETNEPVSDKDKKVIAAFQKEIDEFREIIKSDKIFDQLVANVRRIENSIRHVSKHACGYLVTPKPIVEYAPMQIESGKGVKTITQYEGKYLEDIGLMKFDFLGLINLSIIQNTVRTIKKTKGIDIDIYNIPKDDKKAFEIIQTADTNAVFQLESAGMKKYLKELKPETIGEVSAMVALYRPGPLAHIPSFIDRKHGREQIEYIIPELEGILDWTYGIIVYQEQIMYIANQLAGYTFGEAYKLIKAIGKKRLDLMALEEEKFKKGIIEIAGYDKEVGDKLWNFILPFADYAFNISHSAVYSHVAYFTAYLKGNYPTEFYSALMHADIDNQDKLKRDIVEARDHKIKLLKPNINKSNTNFTIEKEGVIRFGIGGLKGVGMKTIQVIVDERKNGKYKCLDDLCERIDSSKVPKGTIEALIKIGAMDKWGSRAGLLHIYEDVYLRAQKKRKSKSQGFVDLFSGGDEEVMYATKIPDIPEVSDEQKIDWEKEILGVSITKSLVKKIQKFMAYKGYSRITDVKDLEDGEKIRVFGKLEQLREIITKKGDEMSFLQATDEFTHISITVFTNLYVKVKQVLQEGCIMLVSGKVQKRQDEDTSIIANNISVLENTDLRKKFTNWKKKVEKGEIDPEKPPIRKRGGKKNAGNNRQQPTYLEIKIKSNPDINTLEKFLEEIAKYKSTDEKQSLELKLFINTGEALKQIKTESKYSLDIKTLLENKAYSKILY